MKVIVVTNTDHGWDCVEGVFTDIKKAVDYLNEKYNDEMEIGSYKELSYWKDICWVFHPQIVI